jgi:hypothetical protein
MRIEFVRSGGFAGIRLAGNFDTQQLLPEQSSTLDKLVEAAGFFSLPQEIKPPTPAVDRFEYQVTISTGQQTHSVRVSEPAAPENLRPLLDYLTTLTISSKK